MVSRTFFHSRFTIYDLPVGLIMTDSYTSEAGMIPRVLWQKLEAVAVSGPN